MKKSNWYYLLLAILPLVLVITAVFLNDARGPYWLGGNLDPEYVYLLNSLNLAGLKGVGHIDHPGTPVQVLGAVTIRVLHLLNFSLDVDLQTDVLTRPEYYLNAINTVMVTLNVLMLLALGLAAFVLLQNLWAALWLQAALFFNITVLRFGLTRVTPEPLLLFASLFMVMVILLWLYLASGENDSTKREHTVLLVFFAVITGFGIACKITFFPMAVIPLMLLPGFKKKIYYLTASVIAFVFFTLPIVRMYGRFFDWIYNLSTHLGRYGGGRPGVIAVDKYFKNLKQLLSNNSLFSIVLAAALLILAAGLLVPKLRKISPGNIYFKCLAALAAAQVVGLLMVSKHSSDHYLLPVLCLSGITALVLFFYLKHVANLFKVNVKYPAIPVLIVLAAVFIMINPPGQIKETIDRLTRTRENSLALCKKVKEDYKDFAAVYYYRSSSPEYALKFGSDLSRGYHAKKLQRLYKNVYFYDIWKKQFTGFEYDNNISFQSIREKHDDKIIFQGSRKLEIPGIQLEEIKVVRFYECLRRPTFLKKGGSKNF
jgi:hypothetical protein